MGFSYQLSSDAIGFGRHVSDGARRQQLVGATGKDSISFGNPRLYFKISGFIHPAGFILLSYFQAFF